MIVPAGAWLRGEPGTAATTLLLVPHAGGGAGSFRRWVDLFAPEIAPVRVQLPGREDLAGEPPLRRVDDIVAGLAPQLLGCVPGPLALYGHSMGALVAFELARALDVAGRAPLHLFVSGRRAPHLPTRRALIHHLPDDEFATELMATGGPTAASLRHAAVRRYALPLVRADLAVAEEYGYRGSPRLRCPVTAFVGVGDPIVDADEVAPWASETDGPFTSHAFPGDHYFHQEHRVAIAAVVRAALALPAESPTVAR